MTAHTKGTGLKWVGRAIRRQEDPALIIGQGRFTADLAATHWVRFVRSPVAAGKIAKLGAPKGTMVIIAADLKGVKKITPMLHKFNYKPVG
jgi:carbon-monoxide dehydrogenase large subunit